jgi:non-ribosomal peptide synthetase component F
MKNIIDIDTYIYILYEEYIYIYMYVCMYIYIYIYTYIHTYIYQGILILLALSLSSLSPLSPALQAGEVHVRCRYDAAGPCDDGALVRLQAQVALLTAATLAAHPAQIAAHTSIMSEAERVLVTETWAAGAGLVPAATTLQALLEQALRAPNSSARTALENPQQGVKLSYAQLERVTALLAQQLQSKYQVGPGCVVAVAAERSAEALVALLSITRAGAAYLPVDISYPPARLQLMLQETRARVVLCADSAHAANWRAIASHVEVVDCKALLAAAATAGNTPVSFEFAQARLSDCAAVLYTSGSTGQPKGVEISHAALARQQAVMAQNRQLLPTDRVVQETILTFDVAGALLTLLT